MDFTTRLSKKTQLELYRALLTPRLIEEKMLIYLRQGKISKWFSGIGQEAISVGCTMAMDEDEFILPMHRNLGVFTSRNIAFEQLFLQFQGKEGGFTKGRDRSFHFGSKEHNIVGMISHLGPQLGIADGIALGNLLTICALEKIDSCPMEGFIPEKYNEVLKLDTHNLTATLVLPVGFRAEDDYMKDLKKVRKNIRDVVIEIN